MNRFHSKLESLFLSFTHTHTLSSMNSKLKKKLQLTVLSPVGERGWWGVSSRRAAGHTQCGDFHPFPAEASYEGHVLIPKSLRSLVEELV